MRISIIAFEQLIASNDSRGLVVERHTICQSHQGFMQSRASTFPRHSLKRQCYEILGGETAVRVCIVRQVETPGIKLVRTGPGANEFSMIKKSARSMRRTQSPPFKARVSLAALPDDKTTVELSMEFKLHASLTVKCKRWRAPRTSSEVMAMPRPRWTWRLSKPRSGVDPFPRTVTG